MSDRAIRGCVGTIERRMEDLERAIRSNNRDHMEFHYDRVLRAVLKLRRAVEGDERPVATVGGELLYTCVCGTTMTASPGQNLECCREQAL